MILTIHQAKLCMNVVQRRRLLEHGSECEAQTEKMLMKQHFAHASALSGFCASMQACTLHVKARGELVLGMSADAHEFHLAKDLPSPGLPC